MKTRSFLASVVVIALLVPVSASASPQGTRRPIHRDAIGLPDGFRPAVTRIHDQRRYVVQLRTSASGRSAASVRASQATAVAAVRSLGGRVLNRFTLLVNGFSASMTAADAAALRRLPGVRRVTPAVIVQPGLTTSVPFIGATKTWHKLGLRGQGMTVAVIDSGVDYTHADFGGPGTTMAYDENDPTVIEPGTFPTDKVIGGWDFVGDLGYDPGDEDHDTPAPDPDPLDNVTNGGDHGTHVAGICCGSGVPGSVGKGVAPKAKILALKVFDVAGTPDDIIIQAMERAADPNQDGKTNDHVDVINMSLGSDYSFTPIDNEAVKAATRAGIVVVMSAGNAGNQPNLGPAYVAGAPGNAPAGIGVAASIDQFTASTIDTDPAIDWPDTGAISIQDWATPFSGDLTGEVVDARGYDPPAASSGQPSPTDRQLCDASPGGMPFAGKLVLVYKGPFSEGDCYVEDKVINAQDAGAIGVIIWDGFGGLPGAIGPGGNEGMVTIPAVDLSGIDSEALADAVSPGAPGSYNTAVVTGTLHPDASVIPGFEDTMTGFTSEGPSRVSNILKPDISAPGFGITSAGAGSGDGSLTFDGTSMAAPHIAGAAALLVQEHPHWTPQRVKAALMNHATQQVTNLDGSAVSAPIMGSGRVQVFPSAKTHVLAMPGSLSFRLQGVSHQTVLLQRIRFRNLAREPRVFEAKGTTRYSDFPKAFSDPQVKVGSGPFADERTFVVGGHRSVTVWVRLTLRPTVVPDWQQLFGWYYFNPNTDGNVKLIEHGGRHERVHVPWHVSGLASSATSVSPKTLDLSGGPANLAIHDAGAGVNGADLFTLGTKSPRETGAEQDIAAVGTRSFTGDSIDGYPEGLPEGVDDLAGISWTDFLTADDVPQEPVEFGVLTHGVRNTTETQEIDVLVDVGADGIVADEDLGADVLVVKLSGPGGLVCVFDLPSTFDACDALYFADYSNFNSTITGLVVDAGALGLDDTTHSLSYQVVACDTSFDPDSQSGPDCDVAGDLDPMTGTYDLVFDVTAPPLALSGIACGGFWSGDCGSHVTVDVGAGGARRLLVLFPNNAPGHQSAIVKTTS